MASAYSVNLALTGETVATLQEYGFSLYGFRVVAGSPGAKPVVWFQTSQFELTNTISWTEQYEAYTSRSSLIPQGQIDTAASYAADLGEVLQVNNPMGIGEVSEVGGTAGAICIVNLTSNRFTCGISQTRPDGSSGPICAFPLLGNNMDEIIPIEKVFLMFSSIPLNTGVVLEQGYGPGILIDLTGVGSRSVTYDADGGWAWADQADWAKSYPPNQNLVPLLVQPSA
ncbi:hypothetical protein [Longimicrobium sp.]|uniref:hypothetical protein n=1 Tax=Longimicrobium sp. TaxID=2029185 RepID=UPI003B3A0759